MTDEDALLAAISDQPEATTPRLVYADWLDDHDEPVRAEFIRVQCAIADLENADWDTKQANVHVYRRQQELLEKHRDDLLGPLAEQIHERDTIFERGFLTQLSLNVENFVRLQTWVAAYQPAMQVHIRDVCWRVLGLLGFNAPHEWDQVRRDLLTSIENSDDWSNAPDNLFDGRFVTHRWTRLKSITLQQVFTESNGLPFFRAEFFPTLRKLDIAHNSLTDHEVEQLVLSDIFPQLEELGLDGNPITDDGARILANAPGNLRWLRIRHNAMSPAGQHALLRRRGTKVDLF